MQPSDAGERGRMSIARPQLGVHLEIARRKLQLVMKLAGCSVWKREGHPVHLFAALNVRDAHLGELSVQRAKHQLHLDLARRVAQEQGGYDQDTPEADESRDATFMWLEPS